ncbi:MAG: hypothetical protein K8R87_14385 [Verrucomicrobia bacterium]|nr:hypothetical protein [Verrucomicrobiota bacterium]
MKMLYSSKLNRTVFLILQMAVIASSKAAWRRELPAAVQKITREPRFVPLCEISPVGIVLKFPAKEHNHPRARSFAAKPPRYMLHA